MLRAMLTALLFVPALPAFAQEAASAPSGPAPATPAAADAAAPALSQEQVTAFNQAVKDFEAAQAAQKGGDNQTALAKYESALPAIRDAARVQPDNLDTVNFLANTLVATAATKAALGDMAALVPLYEESIPLWRKVVAAKPADAAVRKVYVTILTQVANSKLSGQDKAGSAPLYDEAIALARKSVAEQSDAANKNMLLGALIGGSQAKEDAALKSEVATMSKAMLADGSVDAANKPAAQILAGVPATQRAAGAK